MLSLMLVVLVDLSELAVTIPVQVVFGVMVVQVVFGVMAVVVMVLMVVMVVIVALLLQSLVPWFVLLSNAGQSPLSAPVDIVQTLAFLLMHVAAVVLAGSISVVRRCIEKGCKNVH